MGERRTEVGGGAGDRDSRLSPERRSHRVVRARGNRRVADVTVGAARDPLALSGVVVVAGIGVVLLGRTAAAVVALVVDHR